MGQEGADIISDTSTILGLAQDPQIIVDDFDRSRFSDTARSRQSRTSLISQRFDFGDSHFLHHLSADLIIRTVA
jgi:hypothetical protein